MRIGNVRGTVVVPSYSAEQEHQAAVTTHRLAGQHTAAAPPHLVGASRGDPLTPYLFAALARRYPLVDNINTELRSWQRYAVAATSFHPQRVQWQERFWKSLFACRLRSRNTKAKLMRVAQPFDLVVQVHGLFRTLGAPYVMYVDNTHHQSVEGWPAWNPLNEQQLARWYAFERATYNAALHVFTMGEAAAESLRTFYSIPAERVTVVGGGANFDQLPVLQEQPREPVILFVGNDFERKGGKQLLQAFRLVRTRMPHARLQIVGSATPPSEPGVEVLGRINDRAHLAQLYARASVFCLPSRFEPYGLVFLEAMAYGVPCVSTFVGGISEIVIDAHTGLLVPPDDSHALAQALLRVLQDPAYAAQLGAAGRRRVEQHLNWDLVVDRMAPALDRVGELLRNQRAATRDKHATTFNSRAASSVKSY